MASTDKTISALIEKQLPDFVKADHPKFQLFLEKYYEWLENEAKGNTVYHIMNAEKYRDVDETLDPFIRLFKQELLPYFPENPSLDITKLLKGAREFYQKKGSQESIQWLFRVLYGSEINVFYPKRQILIASDGKWQQPRSFKISLSGLDPVDVQLLVGRKVTGVDSKATCVVESATIVYDQQLGEVLELFVSSIFGTFINNESLEIEYLDNNDVDQTFTGTILGGIGSISINPSKRGSLYNIGDPVVITGGLTDQALARDAVANVANVTRGSIESITPSFGGYGYRLYSNTEVTVANATVDIRVSAINDNEDANNSQLSFFEQVDVDTIPISLLSGYTIDEVDYATVNNINVSITEANSSQIYYNNEYVYANGSSYATANFKGIIYTQNTTTDFGKGNVAQSSIVVIYNVSNTAAITATGFLVGQNLIGANSNTVYVVDSINSNNLTIDANSQISEVTRFETVNTGGILLYNLINGGSGFSTTPAVNVTSYFDTVASRNYAYGTNDYANTRQNISTFGKIAHIYINNGGEDYANGDAITVTGRGYGFAGYVNVDANGVITNTTITNRGEGYFGTRTVTVTSSNGSNAVLTAYGFGEGITNSVVASKIGAIQSLSLLDEGYAYETIPTVSLKVMDMVINALGGIDDLFEGERIYQGPSLENAVFVGYVKSYNKTSNLVRVYNYSGNSFSNFNNTLSFTSQNSIVFTINTAASVSAPIGYPVATLPNPYFYGDGQAAANVTFSEGLIKYPGFWVNTDGFLSADKVLQDNKLYQNYSYVIDSDQSITEYRKSVYDIVHPAGMLLAGRTSIKDDVVEAMKSNSVVALQNTVSGTVTVTDSQLNIVTGSGTDFSNTANVGMLFTINNGLRTQSKLITDVDSDTSLNVESNFVFVGQGKLLINIAVANTVTVFGNTNSVSEFVIVGDSLKFVCNDDIVVADVVSISGSNIVLDTELEANGNNVIYQVIPDYNSTTFAYEIEAIG